MSIQTTMDDHSSSSIKILESEWTQAGYVSVSLAVLWIAFREAQKIESFLLSESPMIYLRSLLSLEKPKVEAPRPAAMPSKRKTTSTKQRTEPNVLNMTFPLSTTATRLARSIYCGELHVTGVGPAGEEAILAPAAFRIGFSYLDEGSNRLETIEGDAIYTDLRVDKGVLIKLYPPRDTFAARRFNRPVWDARCVAYWIDNRHTRGFYDGPAPREAQNFSKILDALQEHRIVAIIDGQATGPNDWVHGDLELLAKAAFNKIEIMRVFPRHQNLPQHIEVDAHIASLPDGMARTDALKVLQEKNYNVPNTEIGNKIKDDPRFSDRPRGRTKGTKNKKGR